MILAAPMNRVSGGEWFGVYTNDDNQSPSLVAQAKEGYEPRLGRGIVWIPMSSPVYQVGMQSAMLIVVPEERPMRGSWWDVSGEDLVSSAGGYVRKVRVVEVQGNTNKSKKVITLLFYGRSDLLD